MSCDVEVERVGRHFRILGDFVSAEPYGTGHINDTYAVVYDQGGRPVRYIFQRINHSIFKDPVALMDNIERVIRHQHGKLAERPDASRRALTLIPARDGAPLCRDENGLYWRAYIFIEDARTYDVVETAEQAREAARAFGRFQRVLADMPATQLAETIPHFHDTPKRFEALEQAMSEDRAGRLDSARDEMEFAMARRPMVRTLLDLHAAGDIPERITHNDTKLNNVMLDDETGEGICVIDLDTVMPGLALYDFGDMVRTSTSPAAEDEKDLSKVEMRPAMFEALVDGYLDGAGEFLAEAELEHLPFSGKLITFEIGLRFLTDHLSGDVYFKTHREAHNLDRCRTQFRLVESIEKQEEWMSSLVRERMTSKREISK